MTETQRKLSGRAELVKFKFDQEDENLRELEAVETNKKGKKDDNKPFDQFKDMKSTYKDDIYTSKLPEVITKEMARRGEMLELEIGQGRDEEQILELVDSPAPRQNNEEKLFAAAAAFASDPKPPRETTPKQRNEPAKKESMQAILF